jgi:uncharacterized NAD(P)/FAD-binding protein YdhS
MAEITVEEMAARLGLRLLAVGDLGRAVSGGYASDLLSCVMAKAKEDSVWVTLQAHPNVVAVASLLSLAAVIVTEGVDPDHDTLVKAQESRVTVLGTGLTTFGVVARLAELGVAAV